MRVVRLIHPDKLSAELDKESICMAERVFILMTEKFDIYRRAHGLN